MTLNQQAEFGWKHLMAHLWGVQVCQRFLFIILCVLTKNSLDGTRSTRLNLKCPTAKYPDRTSIFLSENPTCTYNINFYIKEACGTNPNCSTFTFSYELGHDPRSLFVTPQKASSVSMPYCGIVSSSGEVEGWVTLYNGSDCMTTGSEFSQYQNVWTGVGTSGGKVYDAKGYKSACAFSWECYGWFI